MDVLEGIYTRRSVRRFTDETIGRQQVMEILNAGRWAPSGLNNQPWRFAVVWDKKIRFRLAQLTRYSSIIEKACVCIAVFIDKDAMYHDVKDHQAMGACIQNMLLASHALNLGAVWLGEILNRADDVRLLLDLPEHLELMAVVAIGHPVSERKESTRKDISELILKEV